MGLFGGFYALLLTTLGIREGIKNITSETISMKNSMNNNLVIGRGGKLYYNGFQVIRTIDGYPEFHDVLKCVKTGRILKDYTKEKNEEHNIFLNEIFQREYREAKIKNKKYFTYCGAGKHGTFGIYRPAGLYETDTLKRFNLVTNRDGIHYKVYSKITEIKKDCTIKYELDYENKIKISETEWWEFDGNIYDNQYYYAREFHLQENIKKFKYHVSVPDDFKVNVEDEYHFGRGL